MKNFKMAATVCAAALTLILSACDDSSSASNDRSTDKTPCSEALLTQCPETLENGTICDTRDGKIYKVASFGTQTWMTRNLNYSSCSIQNESWCYEDDEAKCTQYGRLYSWTAMMGIDKSYQKAYANLTGTQRGICPEGFHVPSDAETDMLIAYLKGDEDEFSFEFGGGSLMKDNGLAVCCVKNFPRLKARSCRQGCAGGGGGRSDARSGMRSSEWSFGRS
ncbi:FISUMP domain-containing protein [uncultured Fibrobacter sp.]|uniref:FISUMP domain-containing protein n=1 Tax=uncultured Fibrobacter sp. TaxID=261512 RepID=UPI0025913A63|nr:FISUMP domain-containing protein [uncultured Fibrobacter sp.]